MAETVLTSPLWNSEESWAGTWSWNVSTGEMTWSAETFRIVGDPARACRPAFDFLLDRVHPKDRGRVARVMIDAVERAAACGIEFRFVGFDHVERRILASGTSYGAGNGRHMIGVVVDVTARHRAAREVRELGRRLIVAHERERRRLSRELHDGVCQRLAVLSAELTLLRGQAASSLEPEIGRLAAYAKDIGQELHRVSRELNPTCLDRTGLSASIRRTGNELAAAHRIAIFISMLTMSPRRSRTRSRWRCTASRRKHSRTSSRTAARQMRSCA